ncbi:unnamed protein product [Lactuca saligna]|uniref:Uncharacterized protein n=1 Tax=Lactuca saligna TaxID=75948 RepID=A0AA35UWH6_LACSI|nr:unnamed protein product [Lactuca saligna]CAI9266308.1 unnamed protein product [Lactuca saligna]
MQNKQSEKPLTQPSQHLINQALRGFTSAMAVVEEATSPTEAKAEERSLEEWWSADGGRAGHLVAVRRCSGGGSAVCVEREEGTGKSEGQAWIGA